VSNRFAFMALALLCLLLLPLSAAAADAPRITARLEPEVVGLDETATLVVEAGAEGFGSLRIGAPSFALENFEIVSGPSRSESFRFVNGESNRSVSFQWRLRPLAPGPAHVRGLTLQIGESRHQLDDLEARVEVEAPPGRQAPAAQDPFDSFFPQLFPRREARPTGPAPKIRLQAVVDPPRPYAGQQAVYSLYLLTQADIRSIQARALPEFQGFWTRDLELPRQPRPEWVEIGGERFGRVPLLRKALFPLAPGPIEIGPATIDVVASIAELAAFGAPFGRLSEVRRSSAPLVVEVRPLPAAPEAFRGAVGSFRLDATLDPPAVTAGEAATLILTLTGSGNLRSLPDPQLDLPAGIRSFPPESRSEERLDRGRLESSRTWRYVLVPERSGSLPVPPVEITYFDPEHASFRRTSSPALVLTARPRPEEEVAAATPPPSVPEAQPADPETGLPAPAAALRTPGGPFFLLAAIVVLGLLGLAWHRRRSPRWQSQRRLLARLAAARYETRPRQAAARIEEAWGEYLGERWHLPPGTPVADWGHLLAGQGVHPGHAEELAAFLADIHQLRSAPELAATEALAGDLVERSRALARLLR